MSMLSTLQVIRPILTLFHNPVSPVSVAIARELKTLQEWRNPLHQHKHRPHSNGSNSRDCELWGDIKDVNPRDEDLPFDFEITTELPTADQWSVINTYLDSAVPGEGHNQVSSSSSDSGPILVDWDAGRVAFNNESLAIKLIHDRLKQ